MRKILALDFATITGWAHNCGGDMRAAKSGVWDLSTKRDESVGVRLVRFENNLDKLLDGLGVHLVVFEAVRNASPGMQGALVVLAELQGVMKRWCHRWEVEYRGYSPAEIKKFATGNGNAKKDVMLAKAENNWPWMSILDHNQADALHLLNLVVCNGV